MAQFVTYGQARSSIRVADTAVQLSQIKIPAPAAPVETPAEDEVRLTFCDPVCRNRYTADFGTSIVDPVTAAQCWKEGRCSLCGSPVEEPAEETPAEDEMTAETTTEVKATETETPAPATPTGNMTGSAVIKLMEEVWERIRENHPELPAVVIVTGTAFIGPARWGHFRAKGWKARAEGEEAATNLALGEMFMAGETLARGARQVLETMLHEGAHVLAQVRELKDTSRQGRWHNKTFKALAEELGLEHKRASADTQHGFSFVTLTEETVAKYADLLDELDREIRLVVDLPSFWGTGQTKGDEDEEPQGGEFIGGKGRKRETATTPQSGNLKATCGCPDPLIIRLSRKVLDLGVVRCDECEELFTAA